MKENNKKPKNKHKLSIKLKREVKVLSDKEIDNLLKAVDIETYKKRIIFYKIESKIRQFFYNCSEWKIIISKNNIVYKFSLGGIEKIEYADLNTIEEDQIASSKTAWEKLFKALNTYGSLFIDLLYSNSGHLKIISETLEEDRFKDCPEAVKSAVDTILKCLKIDTDYISRDTFWDIVKKFIHFLSKAKDRKTLNSILSVIKLINLFGEIQCIVESYSNDLEEADKSALNTLNSSLCDNIVNLLGVLIVYNKLNPSKEALWAKEAIREWAKSYPGKKTSVLDEWENIEIPTWKKGKRYYLKNINNLAVKLH